jgi:hypothetical protein
MSPSRNWLHVSVGIAGAMGCYMVILAVASILVGLWLDALLSNERRLATIVCAVAGAPVNLASAVWLTRKLIARILPPQPASDATRPKVEENE